MYKVLTIAGTDCTGGAGVQADIKTMCANGVYAMSVITAVVAQNTQGVDEIFELPLSIIEAQIKSVYNDIRPDAVKIGMVSNIEIINLIKKLLLEYKQENIVVDPVMVATSGDLLLDKNAVDSIRNDLIQIADIITPNLEEAKVLSSLEIKNEDDMIEAAKKISKFYKGAILIKGGHLSEDANDLLYVGSEAKFFSAKRIDTNNTHGTGCTLSSAIASNLAKKMPVDEAVKKAKDYVFGALNAGLEIGKGNGPVHHLYKTVSL